MTRQTSIFLLILLIGNLIAGCSMQPVIHSTVEDRVVIKGDPTLFLRAMRIAQNKCQENERGARYVPDYSDNVNVVAFDCLTPEDLAVAETETAATEAEEGMPEAETEEPAAEQATIADEPLEEEPVQEELILEEALPSLEEELPEADTGTAPTE